MKTRPQTRPQVTIKDKHESVQPEGVKGASADFVCFHCPLVAPAGAKPSATCKIKTHKTKPAAPATTKIPPTENSPNLLKFGLSPGRGRLLTPRPKEGKEKEKGGEKE